MIIFDSTFLIDLMKSSNNPNRRKTNLLFQEIKGSGETYATTFVNIFEMYKGIYKTEAKSKTIDSLKYILSEIPVLGFDENYYSEYGKLSSYLENRGTPIGKFDELIAAIALFHGAKVITNNTKDFSRVPMLEIINH